MNTFDKVIGYDAIKAEFLQIIDMIKNPEYYEDFGARMPKGVLLNGPAGCGKTLISTCFIKESGLQSFTVRRDSGEDFINKITKAFADARENAPAIVFLDDMDKFANEDGNHCNCPEYVAVQSGFDACKDYDVIVIATGNDCEKLLPQSLRRTGRFDRFISVPSPSQDDAIEILKYYMKDKRIDPNLNLDDVVKMTGTNASSVLETVINEAAISAGYSRSKYVGMEHILSSVLRLKYDCPDDTTIVSIEDKERKACHEAGHVIVCECLVDGCIGLASIRRSGRSDVCGFVHRCKSLERRPHEILACLGGKAATELYYPNIASGCGFDLDRAYNKVFEALSEAAVYGYTYLESRQRDSSQLSYARESIATAEIKRYETLARNILLANRDFLERVRDALMEKETLLFSEIQAIKKTCNIKYFEV